MPVNSYRDLKVWQKAMDLVEEVYQVSRQLPPREAYGLVSQIQRAAVSVAANIAEGYGREHRGDYIRHLSIANGSLKELETLLLAACRIEAVNMEQTQKSLQQSDEIGRMLGSLLRRLHGPRQGVRLLHPTP